MKYFKTFETFMEQDFLKDPAEIKAWLDKMGIKKYTIGKNGKIDVDGNVDINRKKLDRIPVQFGTVKGYFFCYGNQLTSLQGAPERVGGHFSCPYNQLTSLQGAPERVGGHFDCSNNWLTGLQGAPKNVGGDFFCSGNQLISLQGAPERVSASFYCSSNWLISLQGFPKKLKGTFSCVNNKGLSSEFLERVAELIHKRKSDWDTEIKKLIEKDPTVVNVLPKEELKRLGLDKENRLKSTGLI